MRGWLSLFICVTRSTGRERTPSCWLPCRGPVLGCRPAEELKRSWRRSTGWVSRRPPPSPRGAVCGDNDRWLLLRAPRPICGPSTCCREPPPAGGVFMNCPMEGCPSEPRLGINPPVVIGGADTPKFLEPVGLAVACIGNGMDWTGKEVAGGDKGRPAVGGISGRGAVGGGPLPALTGRMPVVGGMAPVVGMTNSEPTEPKVDCPSITVPYCPSACGGGVAREAVSCGSSKG